MHDSRVHARADDSQSHDSRAEHASADELQPHSEHAANAKPPVRPSLRPLHA